MDERPPELSGEARAALTAYRRATPMPTAARERVHASLSDHAARPRPAWLWVGVGAIAAALLLWGALGVSDALRASPDGAQGTLAPMQTLQDSGETASVLSEPPQHQGDRRGQRRSRRPEAPATPLPPAPLETLDTQNAVTSPEAQARATAKTPPTPRHRPKSAARAPEPASQPEPRPAPPPGTASRLGAENRLIAETWEHVRAKRYSKARQALDAHASEFPAGVLAPERRALLVIVGCLQHPDSASGKADAYAAAGRSTLLAKVRAACDQEKSTGE